MAAPIDLQGTVQRRVLGTTDHVLWTRIELRRLGLEGRSLSRLPFLSRLLAFPFFLSQTFLLGRHSHPRSHYHSFTGIKSFLDY
jgi:hypothetical protein